MSAQFDLDLDKTAPPSPRHARHGELVAVLRDHGRLTARQLAERGFTDRELRLIVEQDKRREIFSCPGYPGYKLLSDVTLKEIRRVYSLGHQADRMKQRMVDYLAAWHRLGRELPA